MKKRLARVGRLNPPGSLARRKRTGIPGRAMGNIIDPNPPILGDGWTQEGPNTFVYDTSLAVSPVLEFTGAIVGVPYRVVTQVSELTGSGPRVDCAIGSQLFYSIQAPGLYDASYKAPLLATSLTFTVNTNATTLRAVLKAIYVVQGGGGQIEAGYDKAALVAYMVGQGWTCTAAPDGVNVFIGVNINVTDAMIAACDFSILPPPAANDMRAGLNVQGLCL